MFPYTSQVQRSATHKKDVCIQCTVKELIYFIVARAIFPPLFSVRKQDGQDYLLISPAAYISAINHEAPLTLLVFSRRRKVKDEQQAFTISLTATEIWALMTGMYLFYSDSQ